MPTQLLARTPRDQGRIHTGGSGGTCPQCLVQCLLCFSIIFFKANILASMVEVGVCYGNNHGSILVFAFLFCDLSLKKSAHSQASVVLLQQSSITKQKAKQKLMSGCPFHVFLGNKHFTLQAKEPQIIKIFFLTSNFPHEFEILGILPP